MHEHTHAHVHTHINTSLIKSIYEGDITSSAFPEGPILTRGLAIPITSLCKSAFSYVVLRQAE